MFVVLLGKYPADAALVVIKLVLKQSGGLVSVATKASFTLHFEYSRISRSMQNLMVISFSKKNVMKKRIVQIL